MMLNFDSFLYLNVLYFKLTSLNNESHYKTVMSSIPTRGKSFKYRHLTYNVSKIGWKLKNGIVS